MLGNPTREFIFNDPESLEKNWPSLNHPWDGTRLVEVVRFRHIAIYFLVMEFLWKMGLVKHMATEKFHIINYTKGVFYSRPYGLPCKSGRPQAYFHE